MNVLLASAWPLMTTEGKDSTSTLPNTARFTSKCLIMAHTVHLSSEKTGCLANSSGHGFFPTRVPVLADGPASTSRESTPSLQQPYEILADGLAKNQASLKLDVHPQF